MASVNSLGHANAMNSTPAATGNAAGEGSSISANDFLTLLVTEMKNQDPTAQTDPNEYINQLVQVNSLQQLIQINETLSGAMGSDGGSGAGTDALSGRVPGATSAVSGVSDIENVSNGSTTAAAVIAMRATAGNLSIPNEIPAAHRVAQALSGHH
jgi:flagellar basal-body rod modification protein FlgD